LLRRFTPRNDSSHEVFYENNGELVSPPWNKEEGGKEGQMISPSVISAPRRGVEAPLNDYE